MAYKQVHGSDWMNQINNNFALLESAELIELASNGETITGTNTTKGVTPAGVAAKLDAFVSGADGLGATRCAQFTFDVDEEDSAGALNSTIAAHGVGVTIPANAIVMGGFYDVNTPFTSDSTDAGTLAISVEAANDILSAVAISGNDPATVGRKAIIPKMNTPESTSVKASEAQQVTVTVAEETLLTGKLTGYLFYVPGVLSENPASS